MNFFQAERKVVEIPRVKDFYCSGRWYTSEFLHIIGASIFLQMWLEKPHQNKMYDWCIKNWIVLLKLSATSIKFFSFHAEIKSVHKPLLSSYYQIDQELAHAACWHSIFSNLIWISHGLIRIDGNGGCREHELVIEHLVKGCGWPREQGHIVCTCAPHVTRRSGPRVEPSWAHIRASRWWKGFSWT